MSDLIEALTIFLKYGNKFSPTHCEHDELYVAVDPRVVSPEDTARLDVLGFKAVAADGHFRSYRFGSC